MVLAFMAKEIERKFLLTDGMLPHVDCFELLEQAYIDPEAASVRLRVRGDACILTIKSRAAGMTRLEYEFPIPIEDGREIMAAICHQPIIQKTRHKIQHAGKTWEVDEFTGENSGLRVAEIELDCEEEALVLPDWVGREVTGQEKYSNAFLAERPYNSWAEVEKD